MADVSNVIVGGVTYSLNDTDAEARISELTSNVNTEISALKSTDSTHTSKIDALTTRTTALEKALSYTVVSKAGDSSSTAAAITIPAGWGEATILVAIEGNPGRMIPFSVTAGLLVAGTQYYLRNGYYATSTHYAFVQLTVIKNSSGAATVSISSVSLTGTDHTYTSSMKIAYR